MSRSRKRAGIGAIAGATRQAGRAGGWVGRGGEGGGAGGVGGGGGAVCACVCVCVCVCVWLGG